MALSPSFQKEEKQKVIQLRQTHSQLKQMHH